MADIHSCDVGENNASGAGSVSVSAPHIIQYPKQYKPVDGKWAAIASLLGGLIGKWANQDKLDEASDAEDTWRDINDKLKAAGENEWTRVAPERALADTADGVLNTRAGLDFDHGDGEKDYADQLKPCTDKGFEKLCALLECGYQPDYDGILARAKADAEKEFAGKSEELCRTLGRYNSYGFACIDRELTTAKMSAVIGATTLARQAALETTWKMNSDLAFKVTQQLESSRLAREQNSLAWVSAGTNIQTNRYNIHNANGYDSLKLGADFLASAGQNFSWLADSLRKSAELDTGNFGALAALLVALIPQFFKCNMEPSDGCGAECPPGWSKDEAGDCYRTATGEGEAPAPAG